MIRFSLFLPLALAGMPAWGQTPDPLICAKGYVVKGNDCVADQSDLDKALDICMRHSSDTAESITVPPRFAKEWEACNVIYEAGEARRQREAAAQEERDKAFVAKIAGEQKP